MYVADIYVPTIWPLVRFCSSVIIFSFLIHSITGFPEKLHSAGFVLVSGTSDFSRSFWILIKVRLPQRIWRHLINGLWVSLYPGVYFWEDRILEIKSNLLYWDAPVLFLILSKAAVPLPTLVPFNSTLFLSLLTWLIVIDLRTAFGVFYLLLGIREFSLIFLTVCATSLSTPCSNSIL